MNRLQPQDCLLLIVDVQEKLAPAMDPERLGRLLRTVGQLSGAQAVLPFETVISEQYPKGLGSSLAAVRDGFGAAVRLPKMSFSVWADDGLREHIEGSGRQTVIVCGMETHICVYQSVRDLVAAGRDVWVLSDGVASRREDAVLTGLQLCQTAGARVAPCETVLFDWLGEAGSDAFKTVSRLLR